MSERDKMDDGDWMLVIISIFIMVMVGMVVVKFKTDIHDLQRRIATLEQERR